MTALLRRRCVLLDHHLLSRTRVFYPITFLGMFNFALLMVATISLRMNTHRAYFAADSFCSSSTALLYAASRASAMSSSLASEVVRSVFGGLTRLMRFIVSRNLTAMWTASVK